MPHRAAALREMRRVLNHEGRLLLSVPGLWLGSSERSSTGGPTLGTTTGSTFEFEWS